MAKLTADSILDAIENDAPISADDFEERVAPADPARRCVAFQRADVEALQDALGGRDGRGACLLGRYVGLMRQKHPIL